MGKLGKAIAVSFDDPETCQGPRWDVPLDDRLVLDAVACHYYRVGRADLADAAALPPGWEELIDPAGVPYYFHQASGETTWDRPVERLPPAAVLSAFVS